MAKKETIQTKYIIDECLSQKSNFWEPILEESSNITFALDLKNNKVINGSDNSIKNLALKDNKIIITRDKHFTRTGEKIKVIKIGSSITNKKKEEQLKILLKAFKDIPGGVIFEGNFSIGIDRGEIKFYELNKKGDKNERTKPTTAANSSQGIR